MEAGVTLVGWLGEWVGECVWRCKQPRCYNKENWRQTEKWKLKLQTKIRYLNLTLFFSLLLFYFICSCYRLWKPIWNNFFLFFFKFSFLLNFCFFSKLSSTILCLFDVVVVVIVDIISFYTSCEGSSVVSSVVAWYNGNILYFNFLRSVAFLFIYFYLFWNIFISNYALFRILVDFSSFNYLL